MYTGKTKKMTLLQANLHKIRDKSALCAKTEAESVLSNVLKKWKSQPKRAYKARAYK